ncbi:MAG: T9SS type A sorting domain-containing protein [Hymenobacteraceae bacterium]|nr:T9SS type A sorting domain-containing protein [Hymenobacteraceae bacterium]
MKTRPLLPLLFLLFMPLLVSATHINGGYISYTVNPQNPLRYNFRFTMFHNDRSTADDPVVQVSMGDGTTASVVRKEQLDYGNYASIGIYEWEHSYAQQGTYTVSWSGSNRNPGIVNIPGNSDQKSYHVHTQVQARWTNVNSHSVRTIVPAPVEALVGEPFSMNLIAYDGDGDRLTYELLPTAYTNPEGVPGPIPGYQFPAGLTISKFGELRWQNPTVKGPYAISVKITEHRGEQPVGYTIVDLQLDVVERTDQPQLTLVNSNRLTVNYDGSTLARPGVPLKLEYYLEQPAGNSSPLQAVPFSDLDTLGLASPALAVRDTTNGLAVTLTFTPGPDLIREEAYIMGLRGMVLKSQGPSTTQFSYDWDFAYVVVGEQQPTSVPDEKGNLRLVAYPNPVTDWFTLEAPALPDLQLQLYSINGQQVTSFKLSAGKNTIKRPTGLAAGVYTYRLFSKKDVIKTVRLVLQ